MGHGEEATAFATNHSGTGRGGPGPAQPAAPARGLHLVLGRAGSGKTRLLAEALSQHMRRGERAILIVPEQHTYEAERRVAALAGGLLGVQVLSLERLCERVLEAAGDRRTFLTAQGVQMVVRRAVVRRQDALVTYAHVARTPGFAAEVAAFVGACRQACITPDMLRQAVDALPPDGLLAAKLADMALLYADVDAYLAGRYLTADDALDAALLCLPDSFVAGRAGVSGRAAGRVGAGAHARGGAARGGAERDGGADAGRRGARRGTCSSRMRGRRRRSWRWRRGRAAGV